MPDTKGTALAAHTGASIPGSSYFPFIDPTDVSMAGTGTDRGITLTEMIKAIYRLDATPQPIFLPLFPVATVVTVNNNVVHWWVPKGNLVGRSLVDVAVYLTVASTLNKPTFQVRNITNGNNNMLSTPVTVDVGQLKSRTAAVPYVINNTYKTVAEDDEISIDVTAAGTAAQGAAIYLFFA